MASAEPFGKAQQYQKSDLEKQAELYWKEFRLLNEQAALTGQDRYTRLRKLLEQFCKLIVPPEQLPVEYNLAVLVNTASRLAQWRRKHRDALHQLRQTANAVLHEDHKPSLADARNAQTVLEEAVRFALDAPLPEDLYAARRAASKQFAQDQPGATAQAAGPQPTVTQVEGPQAVGKDGRSLLGWPASLDTITAGRPVPSTPELPASQSPAAADENPAFADPQQPPGAAAHNTHAPLPTQLRAWVVEVGADQEPLLLTVQLGPREQEVRLPSENLRQAAIRRKWLQEGAVLMLLEPEWVHPAGNNTHTEDNTADEPPLLSAQNIVLHPDYLLNVTDVAGLMGHQGAQPYGHVVNLLMPQEPKPNILLGNVVNLMLDALLTAQQQAADEQLPEFRRLMYEQVFPAYTLGLCLHLADKNTRLAWLEEVQRHYRNLCGLLAASTRQRLYGPGDQLQLEPAFLSPRYGLQGRLDVLARRTNPQGQPYWDVLELKSGNPPPSDAWPNHSAQAVLYKLLVEEAAETLGVTNVATHLLYSKAPPEQAVRLAAINTQRNRRKPGKPSASLQPSQQVHKVIQLRNQLAALEWRLADLPLPQLESTLEALLGTPHADKEFPPYHRGPAMQLLQAYQQAPAVLRHWYLGLLQFVLREKRLAKVGGLQRSSSQSSQWLDTQADKQDQYTFLANLQVELLESPPFEEAPPAPPAQLEPEAPPTAPAQPESPLPGLWLALKTPNGDPLPASSFRPGSRVILYPAVASPQDGQPVYRPTANQLLKCTVEAVEPHRLVLYSNQRLLLDLFVGDKTEKAEQEVQNNSGEKPAAAPPRAWALEPDFLDKSFQQQLQQLTELLLAPKPLQDKLLGLSPPRRQAVDPAWLADLPPEQAQHLGSLLEAQDYALVLGPPGTGKTRFIIRELLARLLQHTPERLLVLAYTNQAVDTLCAQLEAIGADYVRVGSRISTGPAYRSRLLQRLSRQHSSVDQLRARLQGLRVVVGTVAALSGQLELFDPMLWQPPKAETQDPNPAPAAGPVFHTALVDEAAQVQEPQLIGLLCRVQRFYLVGDDRQLPAVVQQDRRTTVLPEQPPKLRGAEPEAETLYQLGLRNWADSLFERLYRRCELQGWNHAAQCLYQHGRMHTELGAYIGLAHYGQVWKTLRPEQQKPFPGPRLTAWHAPAPPNLLHAKANPTEAELTGELVATFAKRYLAAQAQKAKPETNNTPDPKAAPRPETDLPEDWMGIITPFRDQLALIRQGLHQSPKKETGTSSPGLDQLTVDTVERFQGDQRQEILLSTVAQTTLQLGWIQALDYSGELDRKLNVALTRAQERVHLVGNLEALAEAPGYAEYLAWVWLLGGVRWPGCTNAPLAVADSPWTHWEQVAFEPSWRDPLPADQTPHPADRNDLRANLYWKKVLQQKTRSWLELLGPALRKHPDLWPPPPQPELVIASLLKLLGTNPDSDLEPHNLPRMGSQEEMDQHTGPHSLYAAYHRAAPMPIQNPSGRSAPLLGSLNRHQCLAILDQLLQPLCRSTAEQLARKALDPWPSLPKRLYCSDLTPLGPWFLRAVLQQLVERNYRGRVQIHWIYGLHVKDPVYQDLQQDFPQLKLLPGYIVDRFIPQAGLHGSIFPEFFPRVQHHTLRALFRLAEKTPTSWAVACWPWSSYWRLPQAQQQQLVNLLQEDSPAKHSPATDSDSPSAAEAEDESASRLADYGPLNSRQWPLRLEWYAETPDW